MWQCIPCSVSNKVGNHTAGERNVMPGTLSYLSVPLLFSLCVLQFCYRFKVLAQTVNFRLFWGLALSWFLSLIWEYLISFQILSHHTCSPERPRFWPLKGKTTAGFDPWTGSRETSLLLLQPVLSAGSGFMAPISHHQLCICRLLIMVRLRLGMLVTQTWNQEFPCSWSYFWLLGKNWLCPKRAGSHFSLMYCSGLGKPSLNTALSHIHR